MLCALPYHWESGCHKVHDAQLMEPVYRVPLTHVRTTSDFIAQLAANDVGVVDDSESVKGPLGYLMCEGIDPSQTSRRNYEAGFLFDFSSHPCLRMLTERNAASRQSPHSCLWHVGGKAAEQQAIAIHQEAIS
jgi:hypothetical protein